MKIQTANYPTPVDIPSWWNQSDTYFRVHIHGGDGRRLRYTNAICQFGGSYDNVAFGGSTHGSPHGYLSNTLTPVWGEIAPFDGLPSSFWFSIGFGPGGWNPGYLELVIEIETGAGTYEYVPLAESGVLYSIETLGDPNIVEVGGPAPPAECFWTDLVRVSQVCSDSPVPPSGGAFQITTTDKPWPNVDAFGFMLPCRLLIDFSNCPDALDNVPGVRVNINSFVLTNNYSSTMILGVYGGGGSYINTGWTQPNQSGDPAGELVDSFTPSPVGLGALSESLPLFMFVEVGQTDGAAPVSFSFDISFEVATPDGWRPMDGTGAEVTLIRMSPLGVFSADPVADGYLEVTY